MGRLFLFFLWPLAEVLTFLEVVKACGGLLAFLGLGLSVLLGAALLRHNGLMMTLDLQQAFQRGDKAPLAAVGGGLARLIAGVLLIIPGYLSDILAVLLLLPVIRRWVLSGLTGQGTAQTAAPGETVFSSVHSEAGMKAGARHSPAGAPGSGPVFDADWEDVPPSPPAAPPAGPPR